MSFLSSIFRSRDKPTDSTSGSAYRFFLGGTTSGKTVTERSAMQMTAVYSCVRILSEAIAGLPLHLYKYNEKGGKEKALDHGFGSSGAVTGKFNGDLRASNGGRVLYLQGDFQDVA